MENYLNGRTTPKKEPKPKKEPRKSNRVKLPKLDEEHDTKDIRLYVRRVRRKLVLNRKQKAQTLKDIFEGLYDFLDDFPESTYDDIVAEQGTPQECADRYIQTLPPAVVRQGANRRKVYQMIAIVVSFIVLTCAALFLYLEHQREYTKVYFVDTIWGDPPIPID